MPWNRINSILQRYSIGALKWTSHPIMTDRPSKSKQTTDMRDHRKFTLPIIIYFLTSCRGDLVTSMEGTEYNNKNTHDFYILEDCVVKWQNDVELVIIFIELLSHFQRKKNMIGIWNLEKEKFIMFSIMVSTNEPFWVRTFHNLGIYAKEYSWLFVH